MGKPQSRKGTRAKDKTNHRGMKAKHISRHLDQVYEDTMPHNAARFERPPVDEDLPGLGQHYCIPCARHFVADRVLQEHRRTKVHKQMLRRLREKPYDLKEAALLNKY